MKLEKFDRERLLRILEFLFTEIDDLQKKFIKLDFQTYSSDNDVRRNLERCIENIVNSGLDMAKIILINKGTQIPNTYKEYFLSLYTIGLIKKNLAFGLADGVRLRNILAHQYLDIKWRNIKEFLNRGWKDYKKLSEFFRKFLQKNND
jgi:uncharacterized protein YutE (UPF0331/DUF86 family)